MLALQTNQALQVVNRDPTSHNVHVMPTNNREWNKAEPPGAKVDDAFSREEIAIPVKCNVHPWRQIHAAFLFDEGGLTRRIKLASPSTMNTTTFCKEPFVSARTS